LLLTGYRKQPTVVCEVNVHVLLVEHDRLTREGLSLLLNAQDIQTDQAESGSQALELVQNHDYDLVGLDLSLPDIEGHEVLQRMRSAEIDTPVLILSGMAQPAGTKCLDLGADDVVRKPFEKTELIARVQALARRSRTLSQPILRVGPMTVNLNNHEVTVANTPVDLTAKEYAILELLVVRKGSALTKQALLNHLYGGVDEPVMKIIDVFVCKLRKKLTQAGADNLIHTVWGSGYMIRAAASESATYGVEKSEARRLEDEVVA